MNYWLQCRKRKEIKPGCLVKMTEAYLKGNSGRYISDAYGLGPFQVVRLHTFNDYWFAVVKAKFIDDPDAVSTELGIRLRGLDVVGEAE